MNKRFIFKIITDDKSCGGMFYKVTNNTTKVTIGCLHDRSIIEEVMIQHDKEFAGTKKTFSNDGGAFRVEVEYDSDGNVADSKVSYSDFHAATLPSVVAWVAKEDAAYNAIVDRACVAIDDMVEKVKAAATKRKAEFTEARDWISKRHIDRIVGMDVTVNESYASFKFDKNKPESFAYACVCAYEIASGVHLPQVPRDDPMYEYVERPVFDVLGV